MTSEPTEQLQAEIRRHLAVGNKIEAIKHYREATGVGLAEAKDAVERIEAGKAPLASPADATLPGAEASRIKAMIARGETMAAIKLYRKAAGVDLKAAKEAVDALAAQLSRPAASARSSGSAASVRAGSPSCSSSSSPRLPSSGCCGHSCRQGRA
jgi:ribosomal protein L7/L12